MSQFIYEDPKFVETVLNSLHVDDLDAGADSVEEAYNFFRKAKQKFAEGGFNLRKFRSNSAELEQLVCNQLNVEISNESCVLGLEWDKLDDIIIFNVSKICEKIPDRFNKTDFNPVLSKYF